METPSRLKEPHPIFLYSVMGYFINASKSTTFERHIEIKDFRITLFNSLFCGSG